MNSIGKPTQIQRIVVARVRPCRFAVERPNRTSFFLSVILGTALASFPFICVPQKLPEPARPRTGPPVVQPEIPSEELPRIEVQPLGGEAPPGASKIFLILRNVMVEGVTVYSDDILEKFYAEFIGKKISLAQVFAIAENLQKKYRADGYMLTRVIVPPQSVDDGIFRIGVVEGFVSGIKIEGDIGPVRNRVEAILEDLVTEGPVKAQDLERYLLVVNDIPGIRAVGFLRSSIGEPGASELVVQTERTPFEGYALVNNRGSKFTGPYGFSFLIRENSATILGEQIEGIFFNTLLNDEQRFGQLTVRQLLNNEGLQLELSAGFGPSEPGNGLDKIDLETEVLAVTASLEYPLIRSRKQNLYINGGFQTIDEKVDVRGTTINRDRVRVLYMDATYDFIDAFGGQSVLGLGIRQGLDAFGASEENDANLSRVQGVPDFTSVNIETSRYQPLWDRLGIFLSGVGQYAFNTLLNSEEFKVGGQPFGRGYNPAELSGDSGLGLTAEFQYTRSGPFVFWQSLQGYGFYDFGVVWNRDQNTERSQSLTSAGLGVRNQLLEHLFLDLEVAWPLTHKPNTYNKDPRVFFQALLRF